MPKFAEANPNIKLDFVNGHFGYFYKFGILTNGLGIPLGINFFDEDFYSNIQKEFETPEDQKYTYDNASLKSVVKPFIANVESSCNFRFNTQGIPLCPLNQEPFKLEGRCGGKNCSERFKFNPFIQSPNTVNTVTMRSDLYLKAISKLVNVILAYSLNDIKYIRSIRKLRVISA